MLKMQLNCL